MRIRISMPGTYMAMEIDDGQAHKVFRKMAETLWLVGCQDQEAAVEEDGKENENSVRPETNGMAGKDRDMEPEEYSYPELKESVSENCGEMRGEEKPEPEVVPAGYGGFLYIKCPVCGKIKGFCAKTRLNNFRCDCGSITRLERLVPLYMNCECGRKSRYLTNMDEPMFDMTCYDCGAPVAMGWNEKKSQYETIRQN